MSATSPSPYLTLPLRTMTVAQETNRLHRLVNAAKANAVRVQKVAGDICCVHPDHHGAKYAPCEACFERACGYVLSAGLSGKIANPA